MPTRFYFSATQTPAPPVPSGTVSWLHRNQNQSRAMSTLTGASSLSDFVVTYDSSDHLIDAGALIGRFYSEPMFAQSIPAQTVETVFKCAQARSANDLFFTWKVFLISSTGTVVSGGDIVAFRQDGPEVPLAALGAETRTGSTTTLPVVCSLGDRIAVEIGLSGTPTAGGAIEGHNGQIRWGDKVSLGDLLAVNGSTVDDRPWLEFRVSDIQFISGAAMELRASQDTVEGIGAVGAGAQGELRASQDTFEGVGAVGDGTDGELRASQDDIEGLYDEFLLLIPQLFASQDTFEGLWEEEEEEPPVEITGLMPEGQITTVRGLTGQIAGVDRPYDGLQPEGQITTTRATKGQVNFS